MTAEPAQGLSASFQEKEYFRSDRSEETIQACYELISSGQPLSEILVALKQLGPLNENSPSERGPKPSETQITDVIGQVRAAAPQWQTAQLTELLEAPLLRQPQNVSAALVPTGGISSNSLVALRARLPSARVKNSSGIMLSRPIRSFLFWFIPLLSMVIIGVAGKLLSDSALRWTSSLSTAAPEAIRSTAESIEEPTAARAEAAGTTAPVPATSAIVSGTGPEIGPRQSPTSTPVPEVGPKQPPAPTPALIKGPQRRPAQTRHSPLQRPPSVGWRIPDRLTDGF